MLQTVSVGREHDIISFLVVQDVNQLRTMYSEAETNTILNMTGNLICGQVGGETAKWVSERFPSVTQHKTTVSINSTDTSISKSEQSNPAITPATIATLSSGEFVGILADDPDKEMELKAFHGKIVKESVATTPVELPIVHEVSSTEVEENYRRIKREVAELVEREMARIMRDPVLREMIVNRS